MKKTALITGVTGQDGVFLARFLSQKGYSVVGVLSEGHAHCLDRLKLAGIEAHISLRTCSLIDPQAVLQLFNEARPDEVYHLAAVSSVRLSFEKPGECLLFNVMSVTAILEALRQYGRPVRFFHPSTSEMFGNPVMLPVQEGASFCPESPYAVSKVTGHLLVRNYRKAYGLYCASGIMFNHESVLRPQHFVSKKIIATAVRISQGSKETLALGDMSGRRDWGYAPDYIRAMWLMLQKDQPDEYIIASGEAHSLEEFVKCVFEEVGLTWQDHVQTQKGLFRPSDIRVTFGDPGKAKRELGWSFSLSFRELIHTLVEDEKYFQQKGALRC